VTDDYACRLTVDLDAVAENFATLRRRAGEAEVAPVVKGNAYGVGVAPTARRLWAEGARRFFVARVSEGEALRRHLGAGRSAEILILDGCPPGAASRLEAANLTPVLNSLHQIEEWGAHCSWKRPAALHVDTGMNRLGLRVEEAADLAAGPTARFLRVDLIMSHLACGSDPRHPMNAAQRDAFAVAAGLWPDARASLANTAGSFMGVGYRFSITRPGVGLFGGSPFGRKRADIRTVACVEAPILQIRRVPDGESVGYGAAWRAAGERRVAIIAAGFADGVLRALGRGGYAWFEGRKAPFVGRISMDLIALDVTECPAARPGAWVELLGDHVGLDETARRARTVSYEILARPAHRLERRYVGGA